MKVSDNEHLIHARVLDIKICHTLLYLLNDLVSEIKVKQIKNNKNFNKTEKGCGNIDKINKNECIQIHNIIILYIL